MRTCIRLRCHCPRPIAFISGNRCSRNSKDRTIRWPLKVQRNKACKCQMVISFTSMERWEIDSIRMRAVVERKVALGHESWARQAHRIRLVSGRRAQVWQSAHLAKGKVWTTVERASAKHKMSQERVPYSLTRHLTKSILQCSRQAAKATLCTRRTFTVVAFTPTRLPKTKHNFSISTKLDVIAL